MLGTDPESSGLQYQLHLELAGGLRTVSLFLQEPDRDPHHRRGLQLWRGSLLWSMHIHFYPTVGMTSTGSHELDVSHFNLQRFSDLLASSELDGPTILEVFTGATNPDPTLAGPLSGESDWLLVFLTELVRLETLDSSDCLPTVLSLLTNSQEHDATHGYGRLHLIGMLFLEVWSRARVPPTPDEMSAASEAIVVWINTICADAVGSVQVRIPGHVGTFDPQQTGHIRMKIDHRLTFMFVEQVCSKHGIIATAVGLPTAAEQLIRALLASQDQDLQNTLQRASRALDILLNLQVQGEVSGDSLDDDKIDDQDNPGKASSTISAFCLLTKLQALTARS
jgi:hypothetical protein